MTSRGLELAGLGERVEALSGPDREVDFLVAEAMSSDKDHWLGCRARQVDPYDERWRSSGDAVRRKWEWDQPPYTASLDAAMQLVPEGWGRLVGDYPTNRARCELRPDDDDRFALPPKASALTGLSGVLMVESLAATWPLAIVAAALRARASLDLARETP